MPTFHRTVTGARAYSAGHFELQVDGMTSTAYVRSAGGGWPKMNIADEPLGGEIQHVKHGTTVEIDPIELEVGMAQSDFLMYWIACSWDRRFARHNGAIVHGDFNYSCTFTHEFKQALIEETTWPACDAASKETSYLKVKIRPEEVNFIKGDGHKLQSKEAGKQKLWTASAFRFSLAGLDLTKVNKIDSFTVKQGIKSLTIGSRRLPELEPTKIEFPELKVTMSMAYADSVFDWYKKVVLDGCTDTASEKDGSIEYLNASRDKVLLRINLYGVGIKAFSLPKSEANQDQMKRATFDLYVSRMEIDGDDRYALE